MATNTPMSADVYRALANEKRLQILEWLKNPAAFFPAQIDGDLVKDGVCSLFIAQKLGVSQPTASVHLKLMTQAGLLTAKKIRQWTFYKRNEPGIRVVKAQISKGL
jgi:DNA-binding transcriptional ArsR family regulator